MKKIIKSLENQCLRLLYFFLPSIGFEFRLITPKEHNEFILNLGDTISVTNKGEKKPEFKIIVWPKRKFRRIMVDLIVHPDKMPRAG